MVLRLEDADVIEKAHNKNVLVRGWGDGPVVMSCSHKGHLSTVRSIHARWFVTTSSRGFKTLLWVPQTPAPTSTPCHTHN